MRILAIETSTYSASIALMSQEGVLGEYYFNIGPSHTEKLVPSIDWLLSELNTQKSDLTGVAVSLGPGSFTSLRVGLSTAKGICYSLGIPLVGASSLQALAMNVPFSSHYICPVIDARKGEVFTALFKSDNAKLQRVSEDMVISPDALVEIINDDTIFIGDGALLYREYLEDNLRAGIMFTPLNLNYPRASNVALSVIDKFKANLDSNNLYDELMSAAPHYMRKSEAEISRQER
ncbi:MAG: tRNA (adenosine(37)-N6)-threonylcarbamoyltransferase complex dimerization subunit type 1 TsaB [Thermodesulfobacteriota bacterium]